MTNICKNPSLREDEILLYGKPANSRSPYINNVDTRTYKENNAVVPRRLDTASQRVGYGPLPGLPASGGNASDLNSRSTGFESRLGLKSKFIVALFYINSEIIL